MITKVIEVIADSSAGWEEAASVAIQEAGRTVRNIQSIYIEELQAMVENNRIVNYRINGKISFVVEEKNNPGEKPLIRQVEESIN